MKSFCELLSEIYFHELDTRERIFNRLQLNFAVYASAIAVLAYMARMIDYGSNCQVVTLFYVGLIFSIVLISISIYLSINSLTGFEYKVFPKAQEVIDYKKEITNYAQTLKEYNETNDLNTEIPDPESSTNQYTAKCLARCIDHNSKINEYRRKGVRRSVWFMILSAIPIVFAAFLFIGFDLDATSPHKLPQPTNVTTDSNPVISKMITSSISPENRTKEESGMTSKKQTPPPPPPPKEPELQVSTEDLKAPMPNKAQILNEKK